MITDEESQDSYAKIGWNNNKNTICKNIDRHGYDNAYRI